MKTLFLTFLFCSFTFCSGQQTPSYSQYTLNRFAINPALAGIIPCGDFVMGNRRQWIGFEGAPITYFTNYNSRVKKEDKYPKNFHGYGLDIVGERFGFSSNFTFKAAYAYNIKLNRNYRVSFGVFLGIHRYAQDLGQVKIENRSIDPVFDDKEESSFVFPEVSPGGFLYNKNFFAGLSIMQIYPERIRTFGTGEHNLSAHYYFMTGYRIRARQFHYIPSLMLNLSPFVSPTVDINLTFDYMQQIAITLGSKYLNSGYVNLKLQILKTIAIGYSYEYALNEIGNVAPTTHEFLISIRNCTIEKKFEKIFCPAYQ
jgi:type IX secretion system PorP/SprF family membrane protein